MIQHIDFTHNEWISVKEKLPKKGQRVKVLVQKEMIYNGDVYQNSSEWTDDGEGPRGVFSWEPLNNE